MQATPRKTRPLRDYIVIEVVVPESRIIMPELKNIDDKDFVISDVGPDVTDLKVGDIVQVVSGFQAVRTRDGRDLHFIAKASDVVAVIDLVIE